jgi:hypothetical protein
MNYAYPLLFLAWLLTFPARAQTPGVRFSQLPAPLQLYPRSAQNTADVPVVGRVVQAGFGQVSLQVFRNNIPFFYGKQPLAYAADGADFSFRPTIRAELAEYRFEVFLHGSADSLRVARRDSVVCGDAFLVAGQSNAATLPGAVREYGQVGEFYRTFGHYTDISEAPYNPADTLWALADQTDAVRVGVWAHEVQRLIAETYRIPVAVVNGAFPGAGIQYLVPDPATPDRLNLRTPYGRMLYRVRKAGLAGTAKALFWWQGELDAYRSIPEYPARFDTLYRAWMQDFPNLQRVYVAQINFINESSTTAGAIRDFQRRTPQLYPNVRAWSSLGTAGFDGLHYSTEGYRQHGQQWFRLVARDFYGAPETRNATNPTLRKAFYSTPDNGEITLLFDDGQDLTWQPDSVLIGRNGQAYTRRMRDFIYLDGQAGAVQTLTARGNVARLGLNGPASARRLTYLPAWFSDPNAVVNTYDGPHLRNARGLAAFSFENVTIGPFLAPPVFTVASATPTQVRLEWRSVPAGASELVLERSLVAGGPFTELTRVPAASGAFTDQNLLPATTYFYQLRTVSSTSEAPAVRTQAQTLVFPAPTLTAQALSFNQVKLTWTAPAGVTLTGWALERLTPGSPAKALTVDATATEYTDGGLQPNTTYFYRLKALGTGGAASDWVTTSATTLVLTALNPGVGDAVRLFPNPTTRTLTLDGIPPEGGQVDVFDERGIRRATLPLTGQSRVDLTLPLLPPGVYLLRLQAGAGPATFRFKID